jgi:capsular exopolysaccharide synthesis family protein
MSNQEVSKQHDMPSRIIRKESNDVDLRHFLGLFLSNWYYFVCSLFIAFTIAYGINKYSEKIFTVSGSILISTDQGGSDMTGVDKIIPGGNFFSSQQNLENEIGVLRSFRLNKRVIEELPDFNLTILEKGRRGIAQRKHYKSQPFIILYDSLKNEPKGVPVNIRILPDNKFSLGIGDIELRKDIYRFGERFTEAGFDFVIKLRDSVKYKYDPDHLSRFSFWFNNPEELANEYRSKLSISYLRENASIIILTTIGTVPLQEAEYINKLMEVYRQQGLEHKNLTAQNTINFIDEQLKRISDSLSRVETEMEKFRLSNKIIDLSSEGMTIKEKLGSLSNEKTLAAMQKNYYEYLEDYLGKKNATGDIISPSVMGINDQLLIGLINEFSTAQADRKKLNYAISQDQPLIKYNDSKILDIRNALIENVKNNILNTERLLRDIDFRISEVEKEMNRLPSTERRFINIQRNYDLSNTVYTYMLEKKSEAGIARASNVSGSRVIDAADIYNSSMIKPKSSKNYLLALAFGLLLPGVYIYFADRLHNKILDKKDIEAGTQVPIIGFIGHNNSKDDIPVATKPGTSLSESFRSIRTNLKYYMKGQDKAVISVTSTISGEGKTFISINLATALSLLGKKTLMIGVDLRKPKLDRILDSDKSFGLSTFLIGQTTYEELVQKTDIPNLWYVSSGPIPPNPTELLETEKMKSFMEKAREDFDFIVLDTPPVGIVSDALLLGRYAEVNLFIIRQQYSSKSTLEYIQDLHLKKDLRNLAIVVNDIKTTGYYGYGLRYGYGLYEGYGFNYGYGEYGAYGRGHSHSYYVKD